MNTLQIIHTPRVKPAAAPSPSQPIAAHWHPELSALIEQAQHRVRTRAAVELLARNQAAAQARNAWD